MREQVVYDRYRGSYLDPKTEIRSFTDCFRLKATQSFQSLGKIEIDGEHRLHFITETTYSCRIPMPKYVRKGYMNLTIQEKIELENNFRDIARQNGMTVADRGYQPYSGWLELEGTELDGWYDPKTMKSFYQRAYALIKDFKKSFKP